METYPSTVPFNAADELALIVTEPLAPGARDKLAGVAEIDSGAPKVDVAVNVNVSAACVILVIVRVVDDDNCVPGACAPKLSDTGDAVTSVFNAAAMSSRPLPAESMLALAPWAVETIFAAVFTSADLICAGVKPGFACFTRAAAPATIGVEKLVPLNMLKPLGSYCTPAGKFL